MRNKDEYVLLARVYDPLMGPMNAGLIRIALKMTDPARGARVLDVACGTGASAAAFVEAGCIVSGLDSSPAMLAVAKKKLADKAEIILGDATQMPFAGGSLDLATITLVLHEMDAPVRERVLAECARVLAPGGRLMAIDYQDGPLAGIKGRFMRTVTFLIERMVGGAHYRNYREFLSSGCLPALLFRAGWTIEKQRILSGGNLAALVAVPSRNS